MVICLLEPSIGVVEPANALDFFPLTAIRPLACVPCGGLTLLQAVQRLAPKGTPIVHVAVDRTLGNPSFFPEIPALSCPRPELPPHSCVVVLHAGFVPELGALEPLMRALTREEPPHGVWRDPATGEILAAVLPPMPAEWSGFLLLERLAEAPAMSAPVAPWLARFRFPHDVIAHHERIFAQNLAAMSRDAGHQPAWTQTKPNVWTRGKVTISDYVVMDTGTADQPQPIFLDDGVTIGPFVFLRGPLMLGERTVIAEHASIKSNTFAGKGCKLGGEVHSSIVCDYSNKAHAGFLGQCWVGSWVNLGAETCTSNLKNTYGEITMEHRGQRVPTGRQFLGSFIGDYSRSAINTSIYTGKVIGVASHLYGTVASNVPSFTHWAKSLGSVTINTLDSALHTQRRMFERRGLHQTPADIALLTDLFESTHRDRELPSHAPRL